MKKYKSLIPPKYDLKKVTAPVYLIHSLNDWLSDSQDVEKLYKNLGNAKGKFLVGDNAFNHLDFMYGINANTWCYNKVLGLAAKYKPKRTN